jgi:hypothetical protein
MRGEHVEHRLISFALHNVKQRHRHSLRSLQGSPSKIRCLFSYLPIAEAPGPKADGFRRTERYQLESVEMQWNAPIDVAGVEVESRVVRFRPSDHGVAVFEGTGDVLPDHCPDFTQMNAHIFPPRGFRAPDREPIPRPRRRILNHHDQHRRALPPTKRGLPAKAILDIGNVPLEQASLAEHIPGSAAPHGVPREAAYRGAARDLEGDRDDGFEPEDVRDVINQASRLSGINKADGGRVTSRKNCRFRQTAKAGSRGAQAAVQRVSSATIRAWSRRGRFTALSRA